MRRPAISLAIAASITLLPGTICTIGTASAASSETIKKGKEIAFNRKTGNCLACHIMDDGISPGDIGPPLIAMRARYSDREKLHSQIHDPTISNPDSRMPPFGKHRVLSKEEIDNLVDYLYTL